jgi:hypothetical protein
MFLGLLWLCIMLHYAWPNEVPEGSRGHPSLCRHRASAPAPRSRFLASPARPPGPPVSWPTRTHPTRLGARHLASCPRGDGRARWTPSSIAARIRLVPIGVGWGWAIAVPMVIPAVDQGDSCIAPTAVAMSQRPTARPCMVSASRPSGSGGRWAHWRKAWASAPWLGCLRSTPIPCGTVGRGGGPRHGLCPVFLARRACHAGPTG